MEMVQRNLLDSEKIETKPEKRLETATSKEEKRSDRWRETSMYAESSMSDRLCER
jgi:hypothetical protein